MPNAVLPISAMTEKDRTDLSFGIELGFDWVALSFVQRPDDIAEARRLVAGRAAIMAKIEKPAAIDRLEDRAAAAHARRRQAEDGPQAWDDGMDRRLEQIYGRLRRPSGHRFRAPSSASTRGYSARQVDELCETVLTEIDRQQAPDADMIRRAVFDPAYGQDVYEENQVDAFLDALVDLVLILD